MISKSIKSKKKQQIFILQKLVGNFYLPRFLDEHTAAEHKKESKYGTFKDSKTIPFKWRNNLTATEVLNMAAIAAYGLEKIEL